MTDLESSFRTSDGVELQYQHCASDHVSRSPILFCHGLGGNKEQFVPQKTFSDRYCVVAPSLRGHGKSGNPVILNSESMSFERLAQDILELADHLGIEQFHFVGHSIGSIVGFEIVRQAPERLLSLTSCSISPKFKMSTLGMLVQYSILKLMDNFKLEKLIARINLDHSLSRELFSQMVSESDPKAMRTLLKNMHEIDYLPDLKDNKKLSVLILRAHNDRFVNRSLDPCIEELKNYRNIDIMRVNSAGFMPNVETPTYFNNILTSFLTKASFRDA